MSQSFDNLLARRGLSYDRLRVLMEVAETGSIAKAAGREPVRQSQYSRQLKELAEFFGTELTRREGKALTLTQAGRRLADIAREHLGALTAFDAECQGKAVEIVVGTGDSLIQWLLLPRLHVVQNELPNVSFDLRNLRSEEVVAGIREMRVDFGIVRADAGTTMIKKRHLGRLEYALFVPTALAQRQKSEKLRDLLTGLPLASLNPPGELGRQFAAISATLRVTPLVWLQCGSLTQAFQAVQSGHYAAVLPTLATPLAAASGIQVFGSQRFASMSRDMDLVWNPRAERIRPVIERVAEVAGRLWKF